MSNILSLRFSQSTLQFRQLPKYSKLNSLSVYRTGCKQQSDSLHENVHKWSTCKRVHPTSCETLRFIYLDNVLSISNSPTPRLSPRASTLRTTWGWSTSRPRTAASPQRSWRRDATSSACRWASHGRPPPPMLGLRGKAVHQENNHRNSCCDGYTNKGYIILS